MSNLCEFMENETPVSGIICIKCEEEKPLSHFSQMKYQTGKSVNEHMVQSLEQDLDCSDYNSNELSKVFFVNYPDIDCYSQNIK